MSMSALSAYPEPPPDLTGEIVKLSDHFCDGGSFGDVWRCICNCDSGYKEVAVKALRFKLTLDEHEGSGRVKYVRMARRELGIWRRLDHRNIVPFMGIAYGFGPHVALVSLWMPHGTLQSFLARYDDKLSAVHRLQLFIAVSYWILPMDCSTYTLNLSYTVTSAPQNNVLIDEFYCARLADFGFASVIGETPENLAYLHASTERPGTIRWAAAEHFSQDADVLSGKEPWSEIRENSRVVLCLAEGRKPGRPPFRPIDDQHWDFIQQCWSPVQERLTTNDIVPILEHFLASHAQHVPLSDLLRPSSHASELQPAGVPSHGLLETTQSPSSPMLRHPLEELTGDHRCTLCGIILEGIEDAARHMELHLSGVLYKCPYCNDSYALRSPGQDATSSHEESDDESEGSYFTAPSFMGGEGTGMPRSSAQQSGVQTIEHPSTMGIEDAALARLPTGVQSLECVWWSGVRCGQSFFSMPELVAHLQTAHGVDRSARELVVCMWGIQRGDVSVPCLAVLRRENLNRHIYVHLGHMYTCQLCGKTYSRSNTLKNHLFKMHGL
ncbi:kinase-like protein [Gyrodon lividus]|nr:kinase-like protein [Gyrodon lividus]